MGVDPLCKQKVVAREIVVQLDLRLLPGDGKES
jgi:hypothetical protein